MTRYDQSESQVAQQHCRAQTIMTTTIAPGLSEYCLLYLQACCYYDDILCTFHPFKLLCDLQFWSWWKESLSAQGNIHRKSLAQKWMLNAQISLMFTSPKIECNWKLSFQELMTSHQTLRVVWDVFVDPSKFAFVCGPRPVYIDIPYPCPIVGYTVNVQINPLPLFRNTRLNKSLHRKGFRRKLCISNDSTKSFAF